MTSNHHQYDVSSDSELIRRLSRTLNIRKHEGSLRSLLNNHSIETNDTESQAGKKVDFSSNDYLGLAQCMLQHRQVNDRYQHYVNGSVPGRPLLGATGSRLLSGNRLLPRRIELELARIHNREAALICNSGYDANLSVLSSIPLEGDVIIMDELVHNSIVMGVRMSRLNSSDIHQFQHNDIKDLARILEITSHRRRSKSSIFVVVESVYSMDGDVSHLKEILDISLRFKASVIVDEAHGLGVYGKRNVYDMNITQHLASTHSERPQEVGGTGVLAALSLERHPALLATVYTFGKAAGCHGAVITAPRIVIDYLVNYARPFIYSTALPPHSLLSIQCAYETMLSHQGDERREKVFHLVRLFREKVLKGLADHSLDSSLLLPSPSPIQAILCRGNEACIKLAQRLRQEGFDVFPIRSPTVPKNSERIRIIIHFHNNEREVDSFVRCLVDSFRVLLVSGIGLQDTPTRSKL